MRSKTFIVFLAAIAFATPLCGQVATQPPGGVVVSAADIGAAISRSDTAAVIDRRLGLVPIANEYNVSVAIVRRTLVGGKTPPDALSHAEITEIYQVLEGRAVLVTGGTVVDARAMDPAGAIVRTLIGPSTRGTAISGGVTREIGPGDVVVIPPGTAHGFVQLQSQQLRYLVLRVDPHRVLQPR